MEAVQARMQLFPVSSLPQPIEQKNKSIIKNNLNIANKNLKNIKKMLHKSEKTTYIIVLMKLN